jgi:hypothetical protein
MADTTKLRPSQVVSALADMASQGRYDNVTPQGARNMNAVFELVASLINKLEADEAVEFDLEDIEGIAQLEESDDGTV